MKKLLTILFFAFFFISNAYGDGASGGGARSAQVIGNTGSFNISSMSGTTQGVGLSGSGQSYYVSSFTCSANAAITCGLSSGTAAGNACASSTAVVVAPQYIPANGGFHLALPTPIKVTANSALCCVPSAGTAACTVVYTVAK